MKFVPPKFAEGYYPIGILHVGEHILGEDWINWKVSHGGNAEIAYVVNDKAIPKRNHQVDFVGVYVGLSDILTTELP